MNKKVILMLIFACSMLFGLSNVSAADGLSAKTDQINQISFFKPMASVVTSESASNSAESINKQTSDKTAISISAVAPYERLSRHSSKLQSVLACINLDSTLAVSRIPSFRPV